MTNDFSSVNSIEAFLAELDAAPYPFYQQDAAQKLLDAIASLKTLSTSADCKERLMYRLQYHLVRLEQLQ
ncbi:MAG TPA: hypothetical protein DEB31_11025 [Clostridiales bacterium]|nr:hypothetical protein [Clostridiales bacterium]